MAKKPRDVRKKLMAMEVSLVPYFSITTVLTDQAVAAKMAEISPMWFKIKYLAASGTDPSLSSKKNPGV